MEPVKGTLKCATWTRPFVIAVNVLWILLLCGCGAPTSTCVPGKSEQCFCSGGLTGAQVCEEDGTFSTCDCQEAQEGANSDPGAPADMTPECVPDCRQRECGLDPVCSMPCGNCLARALCTADGLCAASPDLLVIRVDGEEVIVDSTITRAYHDISEDVVYVTFSSNALTIVIANYSVTSAPFELDCENYREERRRLGDAIVRFDGGSFPLSWRGESINVTDCQNMKGDEDDIARQWSLRVDKIEGNRSQGTFTLVVDGNGPRDGQRLTLDARFDVDVVQQ